MAKAEGARRTLKRPFIILTNLYHAVNDVAKLGPRNRPLKPRREWRYNCGVEAMKTKHGLTFVLTLMLTAVVFAQELPVLVDRFGRQTNDALMTRTDRFSDMLGTTDSAGFVIVKGSPLMKLLIQRKIEGCLRWRARPVDQFTFVFGENADQLEVEFWQSSKGFRSPQFSKTEPNYKLADLKKPIELNSAFSTNEYCPLNFDLEWYSQFMKANPAFVGKVVIDASRSDFLSRVVRHRKKLAELGVDPSRVRFLRHHFVHERDEQWWLIPPKSK